MPKPNITQQNRITSDLLETYSEYKKLNKSRNRTLKDIYQAFSTYKEDKKADYFTDIKVNKAHEVVERVLPRIVAKNPRWIVTPKLSSFYPEKTLPRPPEGAPQEVIEQYNQVIEEQRTKTKDYSRAIQDYLEYIFDEYNFENYIRAFAKAGLVYGKSRAKVGYKYEIVRNVTEQEDENGEIKREIKEEVIGEHPFIEVKSWTETFSDPRFRDLQDSPAKFEIVNGVRLADLRKRKDEYFNLDKLSDVCSLKLVDDDIDTYKKQVMQIAGVDCNDIKAPIDKNGLNLLKVWTYYDLKDDGNDKLYEACLVKDLNLLISWKEVTRDPFVEFNVFEDVETNFSVGFVEPIIGLTDELNFQKNSAINYVNQALNRTFIWSPNSNIDPKDLISRPYGVIPTTGDVATAMNNCVELPFRQLPSDYFQVQNDIERQVQSLTFTVDTSNQKSEQALTNTATGARIEFFESNSVLDLVRKNFENTLSQLAYLLLQETFENMEDNIALKKLGADEYWEINKEVLRDAIRRYTIKVEVGSSTYDDIVNRRQDAMAFWNVLVQAKEAGLPVKMKKGVEDIATTFEKKDINDYVENQINMPQLAQEVAGAPQEIPQNQMPPPPQGPTEVTQQVAGGELLTA